MKIEIHVPQLPESVTEATLLNWHKKIGETVTREENLIDIETDKVVLELPAPDNGMLSEILVGDGVIVKSGQLIAYFETAEKNNNLTNTNKQNNDNLVKESTPDKQLVTNNDKIVMPAAQNLIDNANIKLNIENIIGSGRDGRILKEDVINHQNNQNTANRSVTTNILKPDEKISGQNLDHSLIGNTSNRIEERVPMTRLRQKIAERLLQSQQNNAILTTFNEVNMQPIMDLRSTYKDKFEKKYNVKLGFMSFFVTAVINAIKQYPVINAAIDGNDIIYHAYCDIGIAVSSNRGLVVPILRNAEELNLAQIETQITDFGKRAKDGKLQLEELTGGTFSITNGGTFGSMMSTPIINPPQSAILGMHAIKDRAVVENGVIVIRPMMYLALSYDHRLIDGKEAVSALVTIKEILENPVRLLLKI